MNPNERTEKSVVQSWDSVMSVLFQGFAFFAVIPLRRTQVQLPYFLRFIYAACFNSFIAFGFTADC